MISDPNLRSDNKLVFTDREEPRQLFWDTYNQMCEDIKLNKITDSKVINYYGIGGIGKSRLQEQLALELDEANQTLYVSHDMKTSNDQLSVLRLLANQLRKKGVRFLFYDYARYRRSELSGDEVEFVDKKTIVESSPILSEIFDICDCIPVVSDITSPAKYLLDKYSKVKTMFNEHSDILKKIDKMNVKDIYESLPNLFAYDLNLYLEKNKKPLVIFIDTYEALVNYTNVFDDALSKDKWLRDNNYGAVSSSVNILWVICGRNILRWNELHTSWDNTAKFITYTMGDLSEEDTNALLESKLIKDSKMKKYIYDISNGTPLYLELCIDNYNDAYKNNGVLPTVEDIGLNKESLVERYVQYRDNTERELLHILASFGTWTSDELKDFIDNNYPSINGISIQNIIFHSYVIKIDENKYKMHDTVIDGILADYLGDLKEVKRRVSLFKSNKLEVDLSTTVTEDNYVETVDNYIYNKLQLIDNIEDFEAFYQEISDDKITGLSKMFQYSDIVTIIAMFAGIVEKDFNYTKIHSKVFADLAFYKHRAGQYKDMTQYAEKALQIIEDKFPDDEETLAIRQNNLATIYKTHARYEEALELSEDVLRIRKEILGIEHIDTLSAMNNLALVYNKVGRFKDSIAMLEEVLELEKKVLGEDHLNTLSTMHNLSSIDRRYDKFEEALKLAEIVFKKREKILGKNHPNTILSMRNLASCYRYVGRKEEALELEEEVLKLNKQVLGETHPTTLLAMSSLASSYYKLGKHEERAVMLEEVLDHRRYLLGNAHPDTVVAMNKLSGVYITLERNEEAFELAQELLEVRKKLLGSEHFDTLNTMLRVARCHQNLGRYNEALELMNEVLRIFEKAPKMNHACIDETKEKIAKCRKEYAKSKLTFWKKN